MTEFRFDNSDLATLVRDRLPFPWTWISGVEVTQSIQYYNPPYTSPTPPTIARQRRAARGQ